MIVLVNHCPLDVSPVNISDSVLVHRVHINLHVIGCQNLSYIAVAVILFITQNLGHSTLTVVFVYILLKS